MKNKPSHFGICHMLKNMTYILENAINSIVIW